MTRRKTSDVLASARKDLQAQLAVVQEEIGRLAAEEHALTEALSSLDGDGGSSSSPPRATSPHSRTATAKKPARKGSARRSSTRKAPTRRRRRPRGASKSTADRVKELQGLLADGPKSKSALAAALKVSPPRVQQLLAELGSSVSSQPDPEQRRGKLWSLKGSANGGRAGKATSKRSSGRTNGASPRKPSARRNPAAK